MISLTERQSLSDSKMVHIEDQMATIRGWPEEMGSNSQLVLQQWRLQVLKKYRDQPDSVLRARLDELERATPVALWGHRHNYSSSTKIPEYRSICEAVLLEYLLGLNPSQLVVKPNVLH